MIEQIISDLVKVPNEENKKKYFDYVLKKEHDLIEESTNVPYKSSEYFNKRKEAFAVRRNYATNLITEWVKVYGTVNDCPVKYVDTLNIPFKEIKKKPL